jgi:hypothetical protein
MPLMRLGRRLGAPELSSDHPPELNLGPPRLFIGLEERPVKLRTDFGYKQVNIQDQANEGWTNYILKQRQTSSLPDSLDWNKTNI